MKFKEIFNRTGWYMAESFDEGTYISVDYAGSFGNEITFMSFASETSVAPMEIHGMKTYQGLFKKDYVQVFNRGSMFGEKRKAILATTSERKTGLIK